MTTVGLSNCITNDFTIINRSIPYMNITYKFYVLFGDNLNPTLLSFDYIYIILFVDVGIAS